MASALVTMPFAKIAPRVASFGSARCIRQSVAKV